MSPSSRLVRLVALVAVMALFMPGAVVLALLVILGLLAVADVTRRRTPLVIRSALPPVISRGAAIPLSVSVGHRGRGAPRVRLRQPLPASVVFAGATGPDGSLRGEITGRDRGLQVLPAVAVRAEGPLGLMRADSRACGPTRFEVLPDVLTASGLVHRAAMRSGGAPGLGRAPLGPGTDFDSIREWTRDDDIRSVNWRATARVGRPMSNRYRMDEEQLVYGVVDAGRLMGAPLGATGQPSRLDIALDAMSVLALSADQMGDRFGLAAFADVMLRELSPGRASGKKAISAVGDLIRRSVDSDYMTVFSRLGSHKRSLMVVFTDIYDARSSRSMLDAIGMLTRRHSVVVVTATDPDIANLGAIGTASRSDQLMSVVAQVDAERQAALSHLRSIGVAVVDARPEQLGAACRDTYLRLKGRGRI